jgi:hypothetical protein
VSIQSKLVERLGIALAPIGFKRRNNNWHRQLNDVYAIINVQASRYSESCYVNFGFARIERESTPWLPENKCQVRFRIEALQAIDHEGLRLLDADSGQVDDPTAWNEAVDRNIIAAVAELTGRVKRFADLREVLRSDVSNRAFVHKDAKQALGIPL